MEGNTIPIGENTTVIIKVSGDLFLQGEGNMEVRLRSGEDRIRVNQTNDNLYVETHASLDVSVPRSARVIIEKVGGSAFLQDLDTTLVIQKIGGDLALRRIGELRLEKVGGSCMIEDVHQPAVVQKVGGDLTVRHAVSPFDVHSIGGEGSLEISGEGAVSVRAGGDIRAYFSQQTGGPVALRAGGEIEVNLPAQSNLKLIADSGSEEIFFSLSQQSEPYETVYKNRRYEGLLGEGGAEWELRAGGDVRVSDAVVEPEPISFEFDRRESAWTEARDRRGSPSWTGGFGFDRTSAWADMISRRAQEAARRAEHRAQAAVRRTEEQIRMAAEREMRRSEREMRRVEGRFGPMGPVGPIGHPGHVAPPVPPAPPTPKVTEQERMLVLQMLQEGKVTVEQAESLLAALEGRF